MILHNFVLLFNGLNVCHTRDNQKVLQLTTLINKLAKISRWMRIVKCYLVITFRKNDDSVFVYDVIVSTFINMQISKLEHHAVITFLCRRGRTATVIYKCWIRPTVCNECSPNYCAINRRTTLNGATSHWKMISVLAGLLTQWISCRLLLYTRSPAVAEGPRERAVSWNLVKYCTNVWRIALEKAYNRGMTFKVIQGH